MMSRHRPKINRGRDPPQLLSHGLAHVSLIIVTADGVMPAHRAMMSTYRLRAKSQTPSQDRSAHEAWVGDAERLRVPGPSSCHQRCAERAGDCGKAAAQIDSQSGSTVRG